MSIPEDTAGPAVGEACNARARTDRRAGLRGRKGIAAPQTPQSLLSGKTWLYSPNNFAQYV